MTPIEKSPPVVNPMAEWPYKTTSGRSNAVASSTEEDFAPSEGLFSTRELVLAGTVWIVLVIAALAFVIPWLGLAP